MAVIYISDTFITCSSKGTVLRTPYSVFTYRRRGWILEVNPKLLIPCFRRYYRTKIYKDGKRIGSGEFRYGCPPLRQFYRESTSPRAIMINVLRRVFGAQCPADLKCYYCVKVGQLQFIVTVRYSEDGNIVCEIYSRLTSKTVGRVYYSLDYTKAHAVVYFENGSVTYNAILGYITEHVVFSAKLKNIQARVEVI